MCRTDQCFQHQRLPYTCWIKTEISPLERERGRLRGKWSGEKLSFKTRMEDPVRHANHRFRSRVRALRWRRALWGGRLTRKHHSSLQFYSMSSNWNKVHTYIKVNSNITNSLTGMGGATDFKVGVQNRIRERSERKKILYPHFSKCGGTSKQISVGAIEYWNLLSGCHINKHRQA